jgi:hypothetical protein
MDKMVAISAEKTNAIQAIFSRGKVVIGVIHCDPFPGTPKYRGKSVGDIVERALRDAENYISGGVHGLIVENHGDIPFSKPEDIGHETSALMAVITEKVRERFGVPLGINVLANAAIPAMAIALAGAPISFASISGPMLISPTKGLLKGRRPGRCAIAACCALNISAFLPIATLSTAAMLSLPIVRFRS